MANPKNEKKPAAKKSERIGLEPVKGEDLSQSSKDLVARIEANNAAAKSRNDAAPIRPPKAGEEVSPIFKGTALDPNVQKAEVPAKEKKERKPRAPKAEKPRVEKVESIGVSEEGLAKIGELINRELNGLRKQLQAEFKETLKAGQAEAYEAGKKDGIIIGKKEEHSRLTSALATLKKEA